MPVSDEAFAALQSQVADLFGLRAQLSAMAGGVATGKELLNAGLFVIQLNEFPRTDRGADGEINSYRDGATTVIQQFDAQAGTDGAWRSATLT